MTTPPGRTRTVVWTSEATPGRTRTVVWTSEATPAIALVNAVENDVANLVKLVTTSETCDTRPLTD